MFGRHPAAPSTGTGPRGGRRRRARAHHVVRREPGGATRTRKGRGPRLSRPRLPATSAPRLSSLLPHLHQDFAPHEDLTRPCPRTGLAVPTSSSRTGLAVTVPTSAPRPGSQSAHICTRTGLAVTEHRLAAVLPARDLQRGSGLTGYWQGQPGRADARQPKGDSDGATPVPVTARRLSPSRTAHGSVTAASEPLSPHGHAIRPGPRSLSGLGCWRHWPYLAPARRPGAVYRCPFHSPAGWSYVQATGKQSIALETH